MMPTKYGTIGLIVLLVSAVAATTGLANIKMSPALAHGEHIEFITNSEYIKGHLQQAIANKQAANTTLALAHAGHPIEEVFTLMQGPLEEVSPQRAADLQEALEALQDSVQNESLQAFTQRVDDINGMMDEAIVLYAGEEAEELGTKAGVIKGLIETAGVEYSEAVEDGQVIEMIEFQDASAFISRANVTFATIQSSIEAEEAGEIAEFFEQLDESLSVNADPADVQTLLDGIVHELDEAVPSSNENVDFAANLSFIRGHLVQALANKQANSAELAAAHAGHPVHEVYALIEGALTEQDPELDEELETELTNLANQITSMTSQQVQTEVANLNTLLDAAESAVINQTESEDPAFNAMVAIALLETADLEYGEAIENGQIVEMIEYQDSTAFIEQANMIFASIEADMPAEEASEVSELFEQLDSLTASNATIEEVGTVIGGIIHEFEEVFELEAEESGYNGHAYIDKIIELLDDAVLSYQAGDAQEAKALAIEAYLDNYEFIEADIEEDDPELMEKIETDIRVELVEMIDAGRPASEIASHVTMIKADLETARSIVESGSEAPAETKGDSWSSINGLLGEVEKLTGKNATATQNATAKLSEAKSKYDMVFAHEAEEHDPETAQLIDDAFAEIQAGVESGTVLDVTLNKQVVDKLIYKIAFLKLEEELLEQEVEEAAEWFTVFTKKFNYAQNPSNASNAMAELEANHTKAEELTPVILQDLRSTFLLKVKEEITEALEAQGKQPPDNANAQKFAVEGIAYYRTIQPDVMQKLGEEDEAMLFGELEEFYESARAGDLAGMQEEADEINTLLLAYEGKETTGIGAEISGIIDLLQLVNIEYIDAVSDGEIINQEEYDETVLFITRATEKFDAVKAELLEISSEETEEVEQDLATIASLVEGMGATQEVSDTVQHAQSELRALLEASGSTDEGLDGWGYIDKIHELLDQSVAAYQQGSYDEARNLAREAYLDNYEFIEADIAEEDRELMEEIEIDMRVDLVQMIDDRKPAAEVEQHVTMIKTNLETARAIVTPEFPFVILAIAGIMAVMIAMMRFKGITGLHRLP
ncbi:MAG TPA: hypothetical protein VJ742_01615 [Nitrososphaera sp.]|nr:hypothetical protein [Nitrososphaera sp.]